MVAKLKFTNMEDLIRFFGSDEGLIDNSKRILESITDSLEKGQAVAELFSIDLYEDEAEISVKLDRDQWEIALENCLEYFERYELADESIDTYMLLKKIKEANFK